MQAKKRRLAPGVIAQLLDQPHRFQFVQAVRVMLRWLRQNGIPYEQAFMHVLRFQNSLSLSFPASQIEALLADDGAPLDEIELGLALRRPGAVRICIRPAFIGFLGSGGALPYHYSERIGAHQRQTKDHGPRAFLDTFSNRMVGLYFKAWGKYRLEHQLDIQGEDGFLPLLMALGGVRGDVFAGGVSADVAGYYAALLGTRPIAAATVARVLSDYFGVRIELEQFVGAWDDIAENRRSTLGGPNPRLGYGALLGTRQWRQDLRVRLCIGPLDEEGFERFLPRGEAAAALAKMLALFAVPTLEYEVRLILGPSCIQPLVLTGNRSQARRLGWNAFLVTRSGKVSRPDVRYLLRPA